MFNKEIQTIPWQETTDRIYAMTDADVRRALTRERCTVDDFMALISPAAAPYLEQMARLSRRYTRERFGRTMSMFIPLYLTNSCANSCVYCGFHVSNPMARTILTPEEMEQEYRAIKRLAPFENLLLVTGENPAKAGVPYLARALDLAKKYFANLKIEVMPLKAEEYAELVKHGLNGVICFQETYNRERYNLYHPRGMKSKFDWRVNAPDRMGQADVHSIGMGVLIGLEDWRTDVTMMAHHLRYLQRHYWRTKYSVNFPRLRPAENGGFQPNVVMTDRELAQLTFAMRIFDHDVDISYSTRETPHLRDHMATLGVTTMSAESKTEPGGYFTHPQALEQFAVSDDRTAREVCLRLKELGLEPVWKDWDSSFDQASGSLESLRSLKSLES
ncbi:MAG: 2-iminoacetate synthase ThiH [Bacteroides sp.]|nr:2-iminoacetate synthase ThiH [Bacteroides sp.]